MSATGANRATFREMETALFIEIVTHLCDEYPRDLKLPVAERYHAGHIKAETGVSRATINKIIGRPKEKRNSAAVPPPFKKGTQASIVKWICDCMPTLDPETFCKATKLTDITDRTGKNSTNTDNVTVVGSINNEELILGISIRPRPKYVRELKKFLRRHYVTYRYALLQDDNENGAIQEPRVAREIFTVVLNDKRDTVLPFQWTFKIGPDTTNKPYSLFVGDVFPVGEALICLSTYRDKDNELNDRIRSLSICKPDNSADQKGALFGLLSTTRASPPHEPCAACVLFFPIQFKLSEKELHEFRQLVTTVAPLNEILDSDFRGLSKKFVPELKNMIDNRPRGTHPEDEFDPPDLIVRLWQSRFSGHIGPIITHIANSKSLAAPMKDNWRSGFLDKPVKMTLP